MKKNVFSMLLSATIILFTQCGGNKDVEPTPASKFKVALSKIDNQYYPCITPTADGYLLAKVTSENNANRITYTSEMLLLDRQGTIKSSNKVSNADAYVQNILLAQNGECIASGSAAVLVNGKSETSSAIFRVDSKGLPLWIKKIPSNLPVTYTRWEFVSKVVETPDKRLFVMGQLRNDEGGTLKTTDVSYTAGVSETGDISWFKRGNDYKFSTDLIAESDGSVVTSYGSVNINVLGVAAPKLDKYDANGNVLWSKNLSNSNNVAALTKIDADYYVATSNEGTSALRLTKANANGELTVIKTYGNLLGISKILKTADNNLLIFTYDKTSSVSVMVKVDRAGNEIWRKSFTSQTYAIDAKLCADGGFIILIGPSSSSSTAAYNVFKTDSEGNFE